MGTVSTERVLLDTTHLENHGQPGHFGLLSRDSTQPIYVDVKWSGHAEVIELVRIGDACEFDLLNVDSIEIRAATYPTTVLLEYTNAPIALTAAPYTQPQPPNIHHDATIATATTTTLWTPAAGRRFIITHAEISCAGAGRVMLIDGTDVQGRRLLGGTFAAGGGIDTSAVIPSGAVDRLLRIVTPGGGDTFVTVDGYEQA